MAERETESMSLEEAIVALKADANRFGQARVARAAGISNELVCRMLKGSVPRKPDTIDKVIRYASVASIQLEREQRELEDSLALLRKDAREHDAYQVAQASGLSITGVEAIVKGRFPKQLKCIDKVIAYASRRETIEWHAPSNSRIKNLAHCMSPEEKKAEEGRKKVQALRRRVVDLIGYDEDTGLCSCGLSHASYWFMDSMTRANLKRFLGTGEFDERKLTLLEEVLERLFDEPDHGAGYFSNDGSLESFYGCGSAPWEIPVEEERDFLLDKIDVLESQCLDSMFDELFPGGKAAAVGVLEDHWSVFVEHGRMVWYEAPSWGDRRMIRMLCGCASPIEAHCATRIEYWRYVACHSLPERVKSIDGLSQNEAIKEAGIKRSVCLER